MSNDGGEGPDLEPIDPFDEDKVIEEPPEVMAEPAEAIFDGEKGYVAKEDADRISRQGFYGVRLDDGRLELEPIELIHLIDWKRVVAKNAAGERIQASNIVSELMEKTPELWVNYLVFRDLRSRGFAVRQGFGGGLGFRVYARGDKPGTTPAKQLIYVLKEGVSITLDELDRVTEAASAARKKLVFALVDQNGEVNYYRVSQTVLENRSGEIE
ncbi:MAG: tRNA-intron lyase [Candidatus Thorarchaeota archaeon]